MNMHLIVYSQVDTNENRTKDLERRGGFERRGDLTRPLKSRKAELLHRHWWSNEEKFLWYDHIGRGVSMQLSKDQVATLLPLRWLEDDVVNGYSELLRIRERTLAAAQTLVPPARKIFIAPSFFMSLGIRDFSYDLTVSIILHFSTSSSKFLHVCHL